MKILSVATILAVSCGLISAQGCGEGYFECNNGRCVPAVYICDGDNDCGDMSDEGATPEQCPPCPSGFFKCNNGRCVYEEYVCDGDNDCRDGSDESQNCPACDEDKHQCANGVCTDPRYICDGDDDCGDGSDEADENGNCPDCPAAAFQCPNTGRCLPKSSTCNGYNDCGDWSDETEDACPCSDDEIRCSKPGGEDGPPGACIPPDFICDEDGIWDCPNGEDEANCTVRAVRSSKSHTVKARPVKLESKKEAEIRIAKKAVSPKLLSRKPHVWYKVKQH